ncbi:arsenate reductase [Sorangium cellulosum]|uniref:Arsenate reductase n=1 Tax=Sorangium cellulosum TaxID=56 RepID=A0A2L0F2S6_SORCE|nr:Spx/MgsR family RNA polymerase-binding regulatory protein [Sorangium cellulosum]AUX45846.1 arsenate reductase [Sorangium cellulosum]
MNKVQMLSYPGCSSCKKALRWLKERGIEVAQRPIVDQPPTPEELARWVPASGRSVRRWLNTGGQSYRALGKARFDAATDEEITRWLTEDGKLVKRPVLLVGNKVMVGFREDHYAELFR